MSKEIEFLEIREGDRISVYVEYEQKGIKYCRSSVGVAHTLAGDTWRTVDGGHLVSATREMTCIIILLDRPKPPLPTTPGTVFRATEVYGEKCGVLMFVRQHVNDEAKRFYISATPIKGYTSHQAKHITAWEPIDQPTEAK